MAKLDAEKAIRLAADRTVAIMRVTPCESKEEALANAIALEYLADTLREGRPQAAELFVQSSVKFIKRILAEKK